MDSNEVRRQWATRDGEFSPSYYAYYGPNETSEALCDLLDDLVDRSASILELGSSSGRHLAQLLESGYADLAGIDVNDEALDVMAEAYPDLASQGTFYHDTIENVVTDFEDDAFDVVFSVETLQHVHPNADWVFDEIARIAADVVIVAESSREDGGEGGSEPPVEMVDDGLPLYYRDWEGIFAPLGFDLVETRPGKRHQVRAFRASE